MRRGGQGMAKGCPGMPIRQVPLNGRNMGRCMCMCGLDVAIASWCRREASPNVRTTASQFSDSAFFARNTKSDMLAGRRQLTPR